MMLPSDDVKVYTLSGRRRVQLAGRDRLRWFNQGYAAVRTLPEGLTEALPRIFTLVLAHTVARLLRAYTTTVAPPTWTRSPAILPIHMTSQV